MAETFGESTSIEMAATCLAFPEIEGNGVVAQNEKHRQ